MTETWRPVVGWEGFYEVSDHGRVRSLDRLVGSTWRPGRILRHLITTHDRHQVALCLDGRLTRRQVHRLVLEAFIGPCPDGLVGLHWDDDPHNNHLANLRWGSLSQNQHDRVRNGNHFKANQTHCIHGHEFTPDNTYRHGINGRKCKTCTRERESAA